MTVIASQCAGLVFSGANAAYQPAELAHQLTDSAAKLLLVHPTVLDTALAATQQMGWSEQQQTAQIVIALRDDEAGPAATRFKTLDYLLSSQRMEPHPVKDVKNTVAYLGYSSGTSGECKYAFQFGGVNFVTPPVVNPMTGKAKGVRTSVYNMTSVLSILEPVKTYERDVQLAVLPLNRKSFSEPTSSTFTDSKSRQTSTALRRFVRVWISAVCARRADRGGLHSLCTGRFCAGTPSSSCQSSNSSSSAP